MSAIPVRLWTRRCRGCSDTSAHDSHLTFLGRVALGRPMKERFWTWLAWKLPRPLAYWACVRVMVHATVGPYSDQVVPELTVEDTLKRWDEPNFRCPHNVMRHSVEEPLSTDWWRDEQSTESRGE